MMQLQNNHIKIMYCFCNMIKKKTNILLRITSYLKMSTNIKDFDLELKCVYTKKCITLPSLEKITQALTLIKQSQDIRLKRKEN